MNFKSFAAHSLALQPREAAMAAIQTSPYRVLSPRTCSSFRSTASVGLFYFRDRSSVKVFSLFNIAHYSTYSNDEFGSSSKRRSRGPFMAAKKVAEGRKQEEGKYKHTVELPKTSFSMRANSLTREPEIQKIWDDNQVFKRVIGKNTGENFILHDGPPYANGDLHIGHALNKILKDFINRYKLLQNYKVHYVPGWDCHGLPIELKVLQSLDQAARKDLTPIKLRAKAAKFAKQTVKTQMESFKRYGVWADWNNPYLTLDPEYEAAQIEVFGQMVLQGFIYRGRKPVHWSPSSRTALAEAELEYPEGHVSRSIYAIFKLVSASPTSGGLLNEYFPDVCLAIWTTTPWTIPANAAVAVNAKLLYAIVEVQSLPEDSLSDGNKKGRSGNLLKEEKKPFLIVASDLVPALESKWGVKLVVRKRVSGSDLENCRYVHPVFNRECPVVIGGDYITTESGTGLVHTAPGHGQEDYVTGQKYGLPMLSPVDDDGRFTEEAGKFCGLDVLADGNIAVMKYLDEHLSIIMEESYQHKYPYDWRTKKPTIFRATEQWFASVEGFREAVMDAIGHVKWIPPKAENRISAMTSSRSDWCISRQRTWGVPIPVFYHVESREPLMNEETIEHIKSIISEKGSDAWWYMKVEDLLPDKYRDKASDYEKGTDTMDVWFDSGSSWAAVLGKRNSHSLPADLYLEGMDQHRGWFQSSLLTSVATKGKAPYSSVITHGFVLDEKGLKMRGKGRGWSDSAPLLAHQQSQSQKQHQQQQHNLRQFQGRSSSNSHSSVSLEMTSSAVPTATARSVFLGIDVGTGSARAGLFDEDGKLLGSSSSSIQIWKDGDSVEQSSTDIWHAISAAVKAACSLAKVSKEEVKGMGFAATCSLVAVDADGSPVTVSWSGDSRRNIIVWMDHRAVEQAERINSRNSTVLQYCGGALSPEMQPPKLLWVKENLPESWSMVFRWMDLSDWLSYRATGDDTRSLCTTVCKWTYLGHAHMQLNNEKDSRDMEACGWDDDFLEEIGLGDLVDGHHAKIGRSVAFPGHPLGSGLTPTAAKELDLVAGIPVGTSLIDAHAGGVGVMESVPVTYSEPKECDGEALCHRMVLVCGTSTCHMVVSRDKLFIPGVWGPYWSAMVPEYWLTEGGQSATGALLDHIIESHLAAPYLANHAASQCISLFELLKKLLNIMMHDLKRPFVASLTEDMHVLPDFHGNRSPNADPKAKGMVCGLTLDTSQNQLALQYLATVQGIAYGTRHIVEHCNANGHKIDTILACGGLAKNALFIQEHADIIGCPIILPRESEPVLLGAAILGAVAARKYSSLHEAMKALNAAGQVIHPSKDPRVKKYHDAKYRIFRELYEQQLSHRSLMAQALA